MAKKKSKVRLIRDRLQKEIVSGSINSYAAMISFVTNNGLILKRNGENYISFYEKGSAKSESNARVYFEFKNPTKNKFGYCQTGHNRLLKLKEKRKASNDSSGSYIYCLFAETSPSPTCYIGQTTNINRRLRDHAEKYFSIRNDLITGRGVTLHNSGSASLFIAAIEANECVKVSILDKITKIQEHDYAEYLEMESRWFTSAYLAGWITPGALGNALRKTGWGKINKKLDLIPHWDSEEIIERGVSLLLNENLIGVIDLSPRSNIELFDTFKSSVAVRRYGMETMVSHN